jgi:hypothetical protein
MTIEERYAHWSSIIETQKTSGSSIAGGDRYDPMISIPGGAGFQNGKPPCKGFWNFHLLSFQVPTPASASFLEIFASKFSVTSILQLSEPLSHVCPDDFLNCDDAYLPVPGRLPHA